MESHVRRLLKCRKCSAMEGKPVHGCVDGARIISLGQAPGIHEERFAKPFAYTAGKTLFRWFASIGIEEEEFRRKVNMSAVCRCFPGKLKGGDRKPSASEIKNCSEFLQFEIEHLQPELIIPIGKMAIDQILENAREVSEHGSSHLLNRNGRASYKLDQVIGLTFRSEWFGTTFDWIALPHPSGLNTWNHSTTGKERISRALDSLRSHPAITGTFFG